MVFRTDRKGVIAAWTALDPRGAIRSLRDFHEVTPGAFRYTYKWVPVDVWTAPDVASLREAVSQLRDRIEPGERWRVTVERRTDRCLSTPEVIAAVVDLVDRKVDLTHPGKILLIQLFEREAALAVVTPADTLTTAAAAASSPRAGSSPAASPECTAADAATPAAAIPQPGHPGNDAHRSTSHDR
jgi:tRNA(Ser,Leu) C12 N-acetylase TAN1